MTAKITLDELKQDTAYSFLNTDFVNQPIVYLTLGGSKAYGTDNQNSDTDIRGAFLTPLYNMLTLDHGEEQLVYSDTDTVIYSLHKLVKLLSNCNPNVIEMLGTKEEHVLYMDKIGKSLRDNYGLFLSKRAYLTFAGYANAQLRRLENALARDYYDKNDKEKHILQTMNMEILNADAKLKSLNEDNNFQLYIAHDHTVDNAEIYANITIKDTPIREVIININNLNNTIKNYDKINHRNRKKDANHLNKHAMHLIRLYLMGIDILQNHEINTYRKERDLLLTIRNGEMSYDKVFELQNKLEEQLDTAYHMSTLPSTPDMKKINNWLYNVYQDRH